MIFLGTVFIYGHAFQIKYFNHDANLWTTSTKVKRNRTYCVKWGDWIVNPMVLRINRFDQEKFASSSFIF